MDIARWVTILVLLYALFGLIKLLRAYLRTKETRFLLLGSLLFLVFLDASVVLYGSIPAAFMNFHYVVMLVPLAVYVFSIYLEKRQSNELSEEVLIRNAFQPYVSAQALAELLSNKSKLKLGGERRLLSVLYCDIQSFKSLTEKMSPEAVVHLLNVYLSDMSEIVLQADGVLDKYVGDGLWAFWGAPLSEEDHALLSCQAALSMVKRVKQVQPVWDKKGFPRVNLQVGINTGKSIVGNLGSSKRFDYSVWGYQARLAKFLARLNKVYGTRILLSESVVEKVAENFVFREVDLVSWGKKRPVRVYELLGEKDKKFDGFLAVYQSALTAYRHREWFKARSLFEEALKLKKGDGVCHVYLERVKSFVLSPPPKDWDGVMAL